MGGVDLQGLTAAIFGRLASDSLGSAVRANVGIGAATPADSIIHAEELKKYAKTLPNPLPMPARPLLALRRGAMPGSSYDMRIATWRWWIYDDVEQGYWRINALQRLIEQAYPRNSIGNTTIGLGSIAVANIGEETSDGVLGLLVATIQLAFTTRG